MRPFIQSDSRGCCHRFKSETISLTQDCVSQCCTTLREWKQWTGTRGGRETVVSQRILGKKGQNLDKCQQIPTYPPPGCLICWNVWQNIGGGVIRATPGCGVQKGSFYAVCVLFICCSWVMVGADIFKKLGQVLNNHLESMSRQYASLTPGFYPLCWF